MSHFPFMPESLLSSATRLGIIGGTFDPIHYGHLALAEEAREACELDAILFIPAGAPPHKTNGKADAEQRYQMTLLATAEHPHFYVSRLEIERPGLSYTVDTLQALHHQYPQAEFFFIIGADAALDFPHWRAVPTICQLAHLVAVTRPGYQLSAEDKERLHAAPYHMNLLTAPGVDISASEIRARVARDQSLRYLTPPSIEMFIKKTGLYK